MLRDRIAESIAVQLDATALTRALEDGRNLDLAEAVELGLRQLRWTSEDDISPLERRTAGRLGRSGKDGED
jgi:hypothetical protein